MNKKEIKQAQDVIDSVRNGTGKLEPLVASFPSGTTKQATFNDDLIVRDDLPRDAFLLIHDLAYDHEGRERFQYRSRAQQILMQSDISPVASQPQLLRDMKDFLFTIVSKAPGYDWNADPLYLSLTIGSINERIDACLSANTHSAPKDISNGITGPSDNSRPTSKSDAPTAGSGPSGNAGVLDVKGVLIADVKLAEMTCSDPDKYAPPPSTLGDAYDAPDDGEGASVYEESIQFKYMTGLTEALRYIFPYVPCSEFRAQLVDKFPVLKRVLL